MKITKLLILGLLAVEPFVRPNSFAAAKEMVDTPNYGKITQLDSTRAGLVEKMGERYRRLNGMKALIEINRSKETVQGPFGKERAVRFERIANYMQWAGIFEIVLDTGGYRIEWSKEAEQLLRGRGQDPETIGNRIVKAWQNGEPMGVPYYGMFREMAAQVAKTDNPERDAEILEKQLGERYRKVQDINNQIYRLYYGKDMPGYYVVYKTEEGVEEQTPVSPENKQKEAGQKGQAQEQKGQEKAEQANQPEQPEQKTQKTEGEEETPKVKVPAKDLAKLLYIKADSIFDNGNYGEAAEYYNLAFETYFNAVKLGYKGAPVDDKSIIDSNPLLLYLQGSKTLCKGMDAYNSGNLDSARTIFEKALKDLNRVKHPNIDPGKKIESCNDMLKKIEEKTTQPQTPQDKANKLFVDGVSAYENLEYNEAIAKFKEAKEKYKELGDEDSVGKCDKYIEMCNAALKQQQEKAAMEKKLNHAKQKLSEGDSLVAQGDYKGAISALEEAKKLYESLADTNKVVECNKKINLCNGKVLYAEGDSLVAQGDYRGAKAKYEDAQFNFEIAGAKDEAEKCGQRIEECNAKLKPKVELTPGAKELVEIMKEKSKGGKTAWDYFSERTQGKDENEKNKILNQIADDMSALLDKKSWITYQVLKNNIDDALESGEQDN